MDYNELALTVKHCRITTKRLLLRPYRNADEEGLFTLFQDENTMRMDADRPILEKNEEFFRRIQLIKNGPLIWFFIEEQADADFVGYIMIQDASEAVALGFAITAEKQHMGYGTEAVSAVIDLLKKSGIKEIRIKTWEKNLPCQRLADRLGFEKAGIIYADHRDPMTGAIGSSFVYALKFK